MAAVKYFEVVHNRSQHQPLLASFATVVLICMVFYCTTRTYISPLLLSQRLRWAVGAIQILQKQNPLFVRGLHAKARLLYFLSTVGPAYVVPVMLMLVIMYGECVDAVARCHS
jgi:cellulose synthase/poly-beta-1,6-N-acetylglucosamine synthase-like glycosyltransferase